MSDQPCNADELLAGVSRARPEEGCGGTGEITVPGVRVDVPRTSHYGRLVRDCPGCSHPECPARSEEPGERVSERAERDVEERLREIRGRAAATEGWSYSAPANFSGMFVCYLYDDVGSTVGRIQSEDEMVCQETARAYVEALLDRAYLLSLIERLREERDRQTNLIRRLWAELGWCHYCGARPYESHGHDEECPDNPYGPAVLDEATP